MIAEWSCRQCSGPIINRRANAKYCSPYCSQRYRTNKVAISTDVRARWRHYGATRRAKYKQQKEALIATAQEDHIMQLSKRKADDDWPILWT